MRSKWKSKFVPKICFRKNFKNIFLITTKKTIGKNKPQERLLEDNTISMGFCKKFRIFTKLNGYNIRVWGGNKYHSVNITANMVKMVLGSFVFTKRFTRDIHRKQLQSRHKKTFTKKK